MKKVYVLLVALLTASYTHAQVSFGIRAGLNFTNVYNNMGSTTVKPGFQAGVVADIAFNEILSFQPGLQFSQMGYKVKVDNGVNPYYTGAYDFFTTWNYLQIPINLQARFGGFFVQAGPYLGYGIGVRNTIKCDGGARQSQSVSFDYMELKSIDLGIGGGIGYQFGPLQAALNTQSSLINIDDYSMKNFGLALTIAYFFGK